MLQICGIPKLTDTLNYLKSWTLYFCANIVKLKKALVFEEISASMQSMQNVKSLATRILFADTSLVYTDYICN